MSKVAVVYWSGGGNTELMANCFAEGATDAGADVTVLQASAFDANQVSAYDAIAFGCPSMGAEVLEESEFQPMWDAVMPTLSGKKVSLFGSYGWGDGEWMRNWEAEANDAGIQVIDTFIVNETPNSDKQDQCRDLGRDLATA